MNESISEFIKSLEAAGRHETVRGYQPNLEQYAEWLESKGIDPLKATTDDIRAYQRWLAEEYKTADREPLAKSTQALRIACIKAFYGWLMRRGLVLVDVSRKIKLLKVKRRVTHRDYLTLQEATAVLQTQHGLAQAYREGSYRWAREYLNLTLLCLAIATGRRRFGLRNIRVGNLDFKRNEVRIEREKGKPGRVLPVAAWAMDVAKVCVEKAHPILNWRMDNDFLFVGSRAPRMGKETMAEVLLRVHKETIEKNPDLEDLPKKTLSLHSLRVTFAKLLFSNGCNIRSVNELMMHSSLSTTAYYTPLPLEDLRRVCRQTHPRA